MQHKLYNGDCLQVLEKLPSVKMIFADPPDNIGLGYDEFDDKMDDLLYGQWLYRLIWALTARAETVWLSFNARWTVTMGSIANDLMEQLEIEVKPCVQVFTFGQHRNTDLGNNHRPLWRFTNPGAQLYPEQIRVPSWRQRNGDKRASSKGRVPGDVFDMQYPEYAQELDRDIATRLSLFNHSASGPYIDIAKATPMIRQIIGEYTQSPGDAFDFPRITGNSKQRCDWHPTQLHEELVKRCILLSTQEGDDVLDPFGGTGTTLRVCKQINRNCTLIEMDSGYCEKIAGLHGFVKGEDCYASCDSDGSRQQ